MAAAAGVDLFDRLARHVEMGRFVLVERVRKDDVASGVDAAQHGRTHRGEIALAAARSIKDRFGAFVDGRDRTGAHYLRLRAAQHHAQVADLDKERDKRAQFGFGGGSHLAVSRESRHGGRTTVFPGAVNLFDNDWRIKIWGAFLCDGSFRVGVALRRRSDTGP
jgi:hypothetical protein